MAVERLVQQLLLQGQILEVLVAAVRGKQLVDWEIPRIEVHLKVTTEALEIEDCLIMAVAVVVGLTQ
jgi:hypothetical protein